MGIAANFKYNTERGLEMRDEFMKIQRASYISLSSATIANAMAFWWIRRVTLPDAARPEKSQNAKNETREQASERMNERMNEWVSEWMSERADGRAIVNCQFRSQFGQAYQSAAG